jgi:hypothetical protein
LGDVYFVNKGNANKHAFLASVLLAGLKRLNKEDISSESSGARADSLVGTE